jgi:hypothetical protein
MKDKRLSEPLDLGGSELPLHQASPVLDSPHCWFEKKPKQKLLRVSHPMVINENLYCPAKERQIPCVIESWSVWRLLLEMSRGGCHGGYHKRRGRAYDAHVSSLLVAVKAT